MIPKGGAHVISSEIVQPVNTSIQALRVNKKNDEAIRGLNERDRVAEAVK